MILYPWVLQRNCLVKSMSKTHLLPLFAHGEPGFPYCNEVALEPLTLCWIHMRHSLALPPDNIKHPSPTGIGIRSWYMRQKFNTVYCFCQQRLYGIATDQSKAWKQLSFVSADHIPSNQPSNTRSARPCPDKKNPVLEESISVLPAQAGLAHPTASAK